MKIFVYFIVLLGLVFSVAFDNHGIGYHETYKEISDHYSARNYHNQLNHHEYSEQDYDYNYYNDIIKPCPLHDKKCISNFFKNNNLCLYPTPARNPYIIKKSSMTVPHANFTFTINNAQLKGLETGKILEFFINKKTDTLVFEVEFQTLIVDSPKSVTTYYRKGKEPFEVADFSFIDFKNASLTLSIKDLHSANLAQTHVFCYLSDPNLHAKIGPHFDDSKVLTKMKKKWLGYIGLSAAEAMVAQAPVYMSAYLHSQICEYKHL